MVRRFGMLKYYIYLLIFLVSLNADCGSFSEEVLRLSVAQKYKINQNIEQLQIKLKSEKNASQIAKLEKSLAMYESRLENPTQYLRRLQQQREYYQRDDIKKRKREYQQECYQQDDAKKKQRKYMQEYRQRDNVKEKQREYYQRDDIKEKKRKYMQEYRQQDDNKEYQREYLQEYRQRGYAKEKQREHQQKYYHRKKSKNNPVTEFEKESTFSPNIETEIDSWLSLDNFQ